ncbi:MAG: CC_3452 family protein [Asticcacaulis sp.]
MFMKPLAIIAIAGLMAASSSQAQPVDSADLTLAGPAAKADYIIDGAYWTCDGVTCRSAEVPALPPVTECMHVVHEIGAVTAMTWRGRVLTGDELAQCNTRAKKASAR